MKIKNCEALKFTVFSKLTLYLFSKLVVLIQSNFGRETNVSVCLKEAILSRSQEVAILSG
jgi:hypothetical protein